MGTGEALVSFLDDKGSPSVVERAKMLFPLSQIGAIRDEQREALIKQSRLFGMYERQFDRDSAYERISGERMEEQRMAAERERREMEYQREKKVAPSGTQRRAGSKSALDKAIGSAATSIGRSVGTQIVRGILGAIFKR